MEASGQQTAFRRAEEFEIDNVKYIEVTVDGTRMTCRGAKWRTFEVLLSFIGAALMEKRRRFGAVLVVVGGILVALGLFDMLSMGGYMLYLSLMPFLLFGLLPFFGGIGLILVWAVVKRESLIIYTPAKEFKMEGSAAFIDELWRSVRPRQ